MQKPFHIPLILFDIYIYWEHTLYTMSRNLNMRNWIGWQILSLLRRDLCLEHFLEQSPTSSEAFKQSWEEELGKDISVETWKSCIDDIHNSLINAHLGLIQFKVVHRLHFFPNSLQRYQFFLESAVWSSFWGI